MNSTLNDRLMTWLLDGGASLRIKINEELGNRQAFYPPIADSLRGRPIDFQRFVAVAPETWLLNRYKIMRLHDFARDENRARWLITRLLDELPSQPQDVVIHIDAFVDEAVEAGFTQPNGARDLAGAATLASLLLTAAYPDRFVDYPSWTRWQNFGDLLGHPMPDLESHGERIVWAADLAHEIAAQPVFHLVWPLEVPMWVIGALCWSAGRTD